MKYFAILRDSFRETRDSRVLYVMLALSGLLVLVIASTSFRPLTMQEEVEGLADQLSLIMRLQAQGVDVRCEVRDFEQTNDAPEPWKGDYRFTYVVIFPEGMPEGARGPITGLLKEVVPANFWRLEDLQVEELPAAKSNEFRLSVTSSGTKVTQEKDWTHEPVVFFGALPLSWMRNSKSYCVYWVENWLVNTIGGWVAVLVGVVVTAGFIPNMLQRGGIDLLLSKPVGRSRLLVFKYLGGLAFLLVNAALAIGAVWVVLGLRSGLWTTGFLLTILVLTGFFAVLYSVSALAGVLTRSPIVCILVTCAALLGLLVVSWVDGVEKKPRWLDVTANALHTALPRPGDFGQMTTQLLSKDLLSEAEREQLGFALRPASFWAQRLLVSGAFIAVVLGLACWWFTTRDY